MSGAPTSIPAYLEQIAALASKPSVYDHIARHGRSFSSQPLTPEEAAFVARIQWDLRQSGQCYFNAQIEALTLPSVAGISLKYVEGYTGGSGRFPVDHAWLSVNGKAVDPTLRITPQGQIVTRRQLRCVPEYRVAGVIPTSWEFFGVELEPEQCWHSLHHGAAIPLIDDWECRWPLISPNPI